MSTLNEHCKIDPNCNFVIPIDDRSNIGASLSAINLNFKNLEIATCNLQEQSIDWNQATEEFNNNLSNWKDMLNIIQTNSSCWNETFTTVSEYSAYWLKPITLIYPYPFNQNDIGISQNVEDWLNEVFPVKVGDCLNFIVGQELYVFTPEYSEINRVVTTDKTVIRNPQVSLRNPNQFGLGLTIPKNGGVTHDENDSITNVRINGRYFCIARQSTFNIRLRFTYSGTADTIAPDKFVNVITGLKYYVDPNTLTWKFDKLIYNP